MSDDSLLHELSRVAREDQEAGEAKLDGRWDALAAGRLSPEEADELRALARDSPEAAAAYEAFRPLGAEFRARMVESARFQLAGRGRSATAAPAEARRATGSRAVEAGGRRRRWWLPAAALAAASLLIFLWPRELPPLPSYGLELEGHVKALRSPTAEPAPERKVYVPGNRLRLVLMPSVAVDGPVAAGAFVVSADGTRTLDAPAEVSGAGAVRIEGVVGSEIELPRGDAFLLVVVGRPGSLPAVEELRSRLAEGDSVRTAAWSAWKVPLRIEEDPGP